MNSIVLYASRYGNTQKVAEAIASALQTHGTAGIFPVDEVTSLPVGTDLVVIGGPTEVHRMTQPLNEFFARMKPDALNGVAAAAFDTRIPAPRWISGSAAMGITHNLHRAGARVILPGESFFVKRPEGSSKEEPPVLEPGELERAAKWATSLAASLGTAPASATTRG